MAPKTSKGKGVAKDAGEKEVPESELAVQLTPLSLFTPLVDAVHLRDYFRPLWGEKMTRHPATHIIPADFAKVGRISILSLLTTSLPGSAPFL